jgi:hypothetical protein
MKRQTGLVLLIATLLLGMVPAARAQAENQKDGAWVTCVRDIGTTGEMHAGGFLQVVAKAEVDFEAHRDFEATEKQLHELWRHASTREMSKTYWEALVRIALARGRLQIEARRPIPSLGPPDRLFFTTWISDPADLAKEGLALPSAELLQAERDYLDDPRLVAMRKELAEALIRGRMAEDLDLDDPYVKRVLALVERKDFGTLMEMGETVLPILERVALRDMEDFPDRLQGDILFIIEKISGLRAARVSLAGLERGGETWRFRIVRVLGRTSVPDLNGSETLRIEAATTWGKVIERLLERPSVAVAVLPKAVEVYAAGYRSEAIERALIDGWSSTDPEVRHAVLTKLEDLRRLDEVQPLLEAVLAEGRPEDRRLAAAWIAKKCTSVGSLRKCSSDPDPAIRESLALAVQAAVERANWVLGDENLDLVAGLAVDGALDTRLRIVDLLGGIQEPRPERVYLSLARDPAVEVRRRVAEINLPQDSFLRPRLFEILAKDGDSVVIDRVDSWLEANLAKNYGLHSRPHFVPAIIARLRNEAHPFGESLAAPERESIYQLFLHHGAGVEELTRVALELDEEGLLETLTTGNQYRSNYYPVLELPRGLLGDLIERVTLIDGGVHPCTTLLAQLCDDECRNDDSVTELLWRLARNVELHRHTRISAMTGLITRGDRRILPLIRGLFAVSDRQGEALDEWVWALHSLGGALSPADRDPLALELVADRDARPELLSPFLSGAYGSATLGYELAQGILERFFDGKEEGWSTTHGMVDLALHSVVTRPTPRDIERIVVALHQPSRTRELVRRLGETPDPRWIPLLVEALQCPWILDDSDRRNCAVSAAESLASHYSDDAAQALLEGMRRASSASVRKACMGGLERIREFREEEERVFARRTAALERDSAIIDLLSLLEDPEPEIQAEAIRALATLGVVDALPRLIRLLRSEHETVRSAAREAIDRLNDAGDEKEVPEGG